MKSFLSTLVAAMSLASVTVPVMAQSPEQIQGAGVQMRTPNYLGCYKAVGTKFTDFGQYKFQALGYCQPLCVRQARQFLAFVNGTNCLCGDAKPDNSWKIDDDNCGLKCKGYDKDKCGGVNAFAVWNDGYEIGDETGTLKITTPVQTALAQMTGGAPGSSPSGATDTTQEQSTVFVTQPPNSKSTTDTSATPEPAPGPNTAAIAAGVVVGIVGLAGIIGGVFFFIRHKKQKEMEAERRRHESITNFVTKGEKPPSTYSLADSRLEPSVMFQRRQSDGSIADNQDYSRRILKVTNPDDR